MNGQTVCFSGPLASFLMKKMSYRKIALLGSVMVATGVLLMPFLPYIPAFCICFGVLSGMGSLLTVIHVTVAFTQEWDGYS